MRAVVQRSKDASISIHGREIAKIAEGLVLLVGVHREDDERDAVKLADRVLGLRIFPDEEGKMNLTLKQFKSEGQILAVSNFTVFGETSKSRRPSFIAAAPFAAGEELFDRFVSELRKLDVEVQTGEFGADMQVQITNDGPVTLILDTRSTRVV